MTSATENTPAKQGTTRGGAFYRAVWKWHFIASLFVLPFMAMMAVTGILYLFHEPIDEMRRSNVLNVSVGAEVQPFADLSAAAQAEAPGRISKIFVPDDPARAVKFEVTDQSQSITQVWVDPYTSTVTGSVPESATLEYIVVDLHTKLMAGVFGKYIVEALACWGIVMFVTGIYMWWPRGKRGWKETFALPRGTGRPFWRATHIWTGFFAAILVIPMIFTGLFWTEVWGKAYFITQMSMKHFSPARAYGGPPVFAKSEEGLPVMAMDDLIVIARETGIEGVLEIRPPVAPKFGMLMRTEEAAPIPDQLEIHLDTRSGEVLTRATYDKYPPMAWYRSAFARYHVGHLFGDLSWWINLTAAILLFVVSISGFVAWWMRRPAGSLGVPAAPKNVRLGIGVTVLVIVLGIVMPVMGVTLVAALILDWLIFKRLGWFQPANA